ncbi:MAG: hypothetical protein INR62_02055 [Rhodospirillales bacterium]|nr:hypothetical protein [Acetobacter sp.]
MKIGQVFLPQDNYWPDGTKKFDLGSGIPPSEAPPRSPYFLYEIPITKLQIPVFIFAPDEPGSAVFNSSILDLSQVYTIEDLGEGGAFLTNSLYHFTPPVYWQLLVKAAATHWRPMLDSPLPFQQLVNTLTQAPQVYETLVDKRKSPGAVTRQNTFIILAWEAWEEAQATWKERAADMEKQGFGQLTVQALEKRALRLGLTATS